MVDVMEYGGGAPDDEQLAPQRQMAMGDRREVADQLKASKYRTAVLSMLNRTGHARFRRGPVAPPASAPARPPAALDFARCDGFSASASASSSFPSSVTGVTGEGSVSNGRALLSPSGVGYSAGGKRPPPMRSASDYSHGLKRSYDDENHELRDNAKRAAQGGGRCHCSKKR